MGFECDDEYPNCTSNEIDGCGVCDGDNSSCSGCTILEASNYDDDATIDDGSCIYTPLDFAFNQSTLQAVLIFYKHI